MEPPQGVIALLFTDIEGSTALARELGSGWADILAAHHSIVGGAIEREGGHLEGTEGDAFFAAFADPAAAARAAAAAQHALAASLPEVRVRMGLHVGRVDRTVTGYVGLEVHRAARVAAAAHGGQVLLTRAAVALAADAVAVEPIGMHRLKDFPEPEQLFCAVIDGRGAAAFPPPRTAEIRPTNLLPATTALVGRDDDLARVQAAVGADRERLITLTGQGGCGKTTLARVAAESLLDDHPGGVWWVPLATLTEPEGLLGAVASAVGAQQVDGRPAQQAVIGRLHDRGRTLLVLDNLEHLRAAATDVLSLLDALPRLRVLATSQVPLRVPGERCLPLGPLTTGASVELLQDAAARAGAAVGADPALEDIARTLDGLPLALELAAARLRVLTPAQLRDRLVVSMDILRDRGHGRLERHRSLRALIDWSLGLVDDRSRDLFARLGAFAGPVELEELEAVAGRDGLGVLDALADLLDVALVRRVEGPDGRVRFTLPEALRQVAAERLDAAPDGLRWHHAHAERQLELAWPARYIVTATSGAVTRAAAATPEASLAFRWASGAGATELAHPLAAALGARWAFDGRLRDAAAALAVVPAEARPAVVCAAEFGRSLLMHAVTRNDRAVSHAELALATASDAQDRIAAGILLGFVLAFGARLQDAVRVSGEATEAARAVGGPALAGALISDAQACMAAGDVDGAAGRLAEGAQVARDTDAELGKAVLTVAADLALATGRPAEALGGYAGSLLGAEAAGAALQVLFDLLGAANALAALGRDEDALMTIGMAHAQAIDIGAEPALDHLLGHAALAKAADRLGPAATAAEARGRAVAAGQRVATVCRLSRAIAVTG